MQTRFTEFLDLSVLLTGFSRIELLGTGRVQDYLETLDARLPAGVVDELLAASAELPPGEGREAAAAETIVGDRKLGPVAQNLTMLWYLGSWSALPVDWYSAYGAAPDKRSGTVSAVSYQSALQWTAIGAHPPGSAQQGFGSWAAKPEGGLT